MKHTLISIFAVLCLAVVGPVCHAQKYEQAPITISKEKVRQNGKLYYAHTVLEKQTLYSLSKAYGVEIESIYAANPGLKENGLKKNSIILIPVAKTSPADSTADFSEGESADETGTAGTAAGTTEEPAETAETAASAWTVTGTTESAAGTAGTVATATEETEVQAQETKTTKRERGRRNKKDYFIHTVKWYEDMESISRKYGISSAIIMDVNGLTSRKLKPRQQLKIPTNPEDYDVIPDTYFPSTEPQGENQGLVYRDSSSAGVSEAADTTGEAATEPSDSIIIDARPPRDPNKVSAALMLPFNAADTLGANELSMDFYSGALLAARKLGGEGLEVNLDVYDTFGDVLPDSEDNFASSDFIIGLLSLQGFSTLLDGTSPYTYVVSPLDIRTESLAREHSNFIQCSNSMTAQYEDLAKWIAEDIQPADTVVVVYESGASGMELKNQMLDILDKYNFKMTTFSYNILEGRDIIENISKLLCVEGMNRVLIASENEAFVNDVVRNLNLLIHNQYAITLYGGSKIRSFETVDVANLHNTNFHSSLSFYIDYDDPKVRDFLMEYRALYNTEPSQTAFQGYDTMYYFATMSRLERMEDAVTSSVTPMLMSDFNFIRLGDGLVRTTVRRVVYGQDYQVTYLR